MPDLKMPEQDVEAAYHIWNRYQAEHDLSDRQGAIAGIDPASGQIWFGEWVSDVVAARDADGVDRPLLFVRVGSPYVVRKGGRR